MSFIIKAYEDHEGETGMISMLSGEIVHIQDGFMTIMVSGVGFNVRVYSGLEHACSCGQEISLFTWLGVSQDSISLYGFADMKHREIFLLLIGVSGIGPRSAMNILSSIEPNRFLDEVVGENAAYLCTLPGIGKKSAQRIILELKEKISKQYHTEGFGTTSDMHSDALSALVSLGYSDAQARKALGRIKAKTVEDMIRKALKELM
ncbi:MAG: Holliday junction branch migration protein RuvA [Thermodesulfobacteriota bacterium]|nr:Holliday junction branch migration protein RuvA [Thermodesulfobacteriota bacterium]